MRLTLVYVAIYALVCRLSSAANTPYNLPIKFPDGVLVSGGQDTRRQSATWSLLVVLDAPKIVDWLSPVHRIRSVMATLLAVYRATNSTRDSWVQRLHDIELTIVGPDPFTAVPRGRIKSPFRSRRGHIK